MIFDVWQLFLLYISPAFFVFSRWYNLVTNHLDRFILSIQVFSLLRLFFQKKEKIGGKITTRLFVMYANIHRQTHTASVHCTTTVCAVQWAQCLGIHIPLIDSCAQRMAFECRHYVCHLFSLASITFTIESCEIHMTSFIASLKMPIELREYAFLWGWICSHDQCYCLVGCMQNTTYVSEPFPFSLNNFPLTFGSGL